MTTTTTIETQYQRPLSERDKTPTNDKTSEYNLSTLDKVTHTTIGNILRAQNQILEILTAYPCNATELGAYRHALLIYSGEVWLTKDGITTAVTIK